MRVSQHGKQRIVERDNGVSCIAEAKKVAKLAYSAGKTINSFQMIPSFYTYLQHKRNQTRDCSLRVYRGNIYIWRGSKRTLVTAYPIPDRFRKEIEEVEG